MCYIQNNIFFFFSVPDSLSTFRRRKPRSLWQRSKPRRTLPSTDLHGRRRDSRNSTPSCKNVLSRQFRQLNVDIRSVDVTHVSSTATSNGRRSQHRDLFVFAATTPSPLWWLCVAYNEQKWSTQDSDVFRWRWNHWLLQRRKCDDGLFSFAATSFTSLWRWRFEWTTERKRRRKNVEKRNAWYELSRLRREQCLKFLKVKRNFLRNVPLTAYLRQKQKKTFIQQTVFKYHFSVSQRNNFAYFWLSKSLH